MQFLVRFILGGFLIAVLPVVASRFGNKAAGILAVLPITIGIGLLVLLQARGIDSIKDAALSSLFTLPATAMFLSVILLLTHRHSFWLAFAAGLGAWLIVALAMHWLLN